MGKKAEAGTPKAIANASKSKGLQRLRFYCQVCQKQCRDENAFKQHSMSEGHVRQMLVVGESADTYINQYSSDFKNDFIALLSRRWGTKRIPANQVYQEFIQDKHHSHMNATKWVTLTGFIQYLGKEGICHVDETEKGWFIAWIDSSPAALARQDAALKKERADMDDESRQRKMLKEQMERAKAAEEQRLAASRSADGNGTEDSAVASTSKVRDEDADIDVTAIQPIKLSMGGFGGTNREKEAERSQSQNASGGTTAAAEDNAATAQSTRPGMSFGASTTGTSLAKPKVNPLKMGGKPNPLKSNPLKTMSSGSSSSSSSSKPAANNSTSSAASANTNKRPLSAVEAIVMEEMEKKRKRENATWSGNKGHGREGLQQRR